MVDFHIGEYTLAIMPKYVFSSLILMEVML